ncbi:unnamed protein product [Porites lobata]|uniref:Uncharacterized protein n=1 Tax=Porites lobata TaxID=104759 RepID=A0ABN8RRF6_9CNID|nr:unnamed protein product [Porites lobata]
MFQELSDSESERACSLQQAKVSPSQQSHSSSLGYSGSLIMVDSESEPLNSSEDEYFPGDEEMHADDDFVGMEVTVPYRSPLKELFQKGMSKFWAYSEDTNKPLAGVISPVIASKHKMEEMAIGSGVFWYPTQRLNALAEGKSVGTMTAYLIDVMFDKKNFNDFKLGRRGQLGLQTAVPQIIKAITAFVQSQFKDGNVISKVRKTIQDKCTASRRGISKTK